MIEQKTKIGVTLAGGGLQGFSHIGALKALEELGINIEIGFNFLLHKETRVEGIIKGEEISKLINKEANIKNINLIKDIKKRKVAIATTETKTMKKFILTSEELQKLYEECIHELKLINIDITDKDKIGTIDIKLSKRASKRYGCCKQETPDTRYYHYIKRGRKKIKVYDRFLNHHIEISKWVMELDKKIIKNTIMHEIIHCMPNCNNHGKEFKAYANYININLGYEIKRLGNKKEDYKQSNLEYKEQEFKYKIICKDCGFIYYRQRMKKNFLRDYRCGKCKGKLFISHENETKLSEEKKYYTYMIRCEDNSLYTGMTTDII